MMLNNWVNEERNVDINISEIVFKFYPIMQSLEWLIRSKYIWKKKDNRYTIQKACYLVKLSKCKKVFRLKTCPKGVLQTQLEKYRFCIFTRSYFAWLAENSPINKINLQQVNRK